MPSEEINAMGIIDDALATIQEPEAIQRVLKWVVDKYNVKNVEVTSGTRSVQSANLESNQETGKPTIPPITKNEIPGIAIYSGDDKINFTFRDIKAKNANDAAVRLALVSTYIYERFTSKSVAPRQKTLKPLLKDWRIDNGNSRHVIGSHKGIITKGKNEIRLDSHAKEDAERIIEEMLNDDVKGIWSPNKVGKSTKTRAKTKSEKKK